MNDRKSKPRPAAESKRAGVSRRLVADKWVSASPGVGATTIFSEFVRALQLKHNTKPAKRNLK